MGKHLLSSYQIELVFSPAMEAGAFLLPNPLTLTHQTHKLGSIPRFSSSSSSSRSITVKVSSRNSQEIDNIVTKPKRELVADWVAENDDLVRSLPIYVGGISLLAVLCNRAVSGIAPVADASSSQSRADLLTLGLAVTNILNGLVWISIRPKAIAVVNPEGVECQRTYHTLPDYVISELIWAWESLSESTCCRSLVIIYDKKCVLQIGYAASSSSPDSSEALAVDSDKLIQGSLYQGIMRTNSQTYLANLSLYPAKLELPFLPSNTQAVILQPLGDKGLAIIGGDMIRGFTTSDQAWIASVAEKLDATLAKVMDEIPTAVGDGI